MMSPAEMSPPLWLVTKLLLLCLLAARPNWAQVIRLRHPELGRPLTHLRTPLFQNQHSGDGSSQAGAEHQRRPPSPVPPSGRFTNERPPANIRNRRPPVPGNIIVRFDPDHEIQRLEYVMRDGRLATVYSRNHAPEPPPASGAQQRQTATAAQPDPPATEAKRPEPPPPPPSPPLATSTAKPLGEPEVRLTELHDEFSAPPPPVGGHHAIATIDLNRDELDETDELEEEEEDGEGNETGEILATLAGGAIRHGLKPQNLQKAKGMIARVKQKFKQLPHVIGEKLRAKSSLGRIFLDHEGGSVEQFEQVEEASPVKQRPTGQHALPDQSAGNIIASILDQQQLVKQPQRQQQVQQVRPIQQLEPSHRMQWSRVTAKPPAGSTQPIPPAAQPPRPPVEDLSPQQFEPE